VTQGKLAKRIAVIVNRERPLFEVVLTRYSGGGLTNFLDRRQEQPYQDRNDGDDDQ
jgi:hypothetical protein